MTLSIAHIPCRDIAVWQCADTKHPCTREHRLGRCFIDVLQPTVVLEDQGCWPPRRSSGSACNRKWIAVGILALAAGQAAPDMTFPSFAPRATSACLAAETSSAQKPIFGGRLPTREYRCEAIMPPPASNSIQPRSSFSTARPKASR